MSGDSYSTITDAKQTTNSYTSNEEFMFNIRYCFIGTGQGCIWWDLPLAIIIVSIGIYFIRKKMLKKVEDNGKKR